MKLAIDGGTPVTVASVSALPFDAEHPQASAGEAPVALVLDANNIYWSGWHGDEACQVRMAYAAKLLSRAVTTTPWLRPFPDS
jgi:hypothetical protein